MPEKIITYESIYEVLRKEKYEQEVQKLSNTFFSEIINYLKEKQAIVDSQKSQDSIFSKEIEKTEKQIQNIKKIIKETYDRRETKIIQLAIFSARNNTPTDTSNLLPEEKELYDSLIQTLTRYRTGIINNLLNHKMPLISKPKGIKKENQEGVKLVRFLHAVPKFMGEDLNIYGPFSQEDIASLPPKVASLLINKKRVKEVKT